MDQTKLASDTQLEQARLQLDQEKAAAEIEIEREKAGLEREKATADVQITVAKNQSDDAFRKKEQIASTLEQSEFIGNIREQLEEDLMADIENKLGQLIQVMAENSSQQNNAIAQAVQQMAEAVEKLNQPKKIVKDKQGRPIGVETVNTA
jgi:hypothetical protein